MAFSTPTTAVTDAPPNISVSISGTVQEGSTLTAVVTGAESDDQLAYAWIYNGNTLSTGSSYTLQPTDEGHRITLSLTDTADHGGGSVTKTAVTAPVADADVLSVASNPALNASAMQAFSGTVATFTDTYTGNTASDFAATISWGDGAHSAGTVSYLAGAISVSGSHT
jgi:hypothetical protein